MCRAIRFQLVKIFVYFVLPATDAALSVDVYVLLYSPHHLRVPLTKNNVPERLVDNVPHVQVLPLKMVSTRVDIALAGDLREELTAITRVVITFLFLHLCTLNYDRVTLACERLGREKNILVF